MWSRRVENNFFATVAAVFRHLHPAMKELEVPQVPAWAEANKPRVAAFLELLDKELATREFIAGDHYSVADITAQVTVDFMKPARLTVPDESHQREALARGGVGTAECEGLSSKGLQHFRCAAQRQGGNPDPCCSVLDARLRGHEREFETSLG